MLTNVGQMLRNLSNVANARGPDPRAPLGGRARPARGRHGEDQGRTGGSGSSRKNNEFLTKVLVTCSAYV